MKSVLFLVTSVCKIEEINRQTGFYLDELAIPLKAVVDKGWKATIASVRGGEPPIEYRTLRPKSIRTEAQQWLLDSDEYLKKLRESVAISEIDPRDYDAIFMPGGHGVMWDFRQTPAIGRLVSQFYDAGKAVGAICHGPAGLLAAVSAKSGRPVCEGKKVTCFTNEEEEKVGMTSVVPFLVEDELKKQGAIFVKGEKRTPHCVADGNIITGQNPESSPLIAAALVDFLS
ncbi:type 1 glutamine amidotransferase domain-containing protein [Affinibrenneria salicis]|uniref:Type 1 glutamine amidotransferase domain-containing protein n=1 Tax=Affinibrenneria salicis TaxID=2590031 RepID=A0A5J5FYQ3_9GAMM|nr:type 1 glutamine amidotransferase domain-containing protein [Affinibrenneria salicis]KAA8999352.1 type 1 glutamine amidotransferase domain-containing protein [Affinibrenneria salicis]